MRFCLFNTEYITRMRKFYFQLIEVSSPCSLFVCNLTLEQLGIEMGTGEYITGSNPAMDWHPVRPEGGGGGGRG